MNKLEQLLEKLNQESQKIEKKIHDSKPKSKISIYGKSFVFTGAMKSMTREQAIHSVGRKGGEVKAGVSRNVDYLVCEDSTTTKAKKAKSYGIQIINEQEFLEALESK